VVYVVSSGAPPSCQTNGERIKMHEVISGSLLCNWTTTPIRIGALIENLNDISVSFYKYLPNWTDVLRQAVSDLWSTNWNVTVTQQVKKFPAFYGARCFITVFIVACKFSLSWARWIQSTPSHPHPMSLRTILIYSRLRLGLQIFQPKFCMHFSFLPCGLLV
jgi:hypothetical protein